MFGSDGRIIESGTDGMGQFDLSVLILQNVSLTPLEHAEFSAFKTSGMLAPGDAASTGFHTHQADGLVFQEIEEETNRIGASPDTGDHFIG